MSYELEAVGNINPYMSWTTTWYFMAVKARFDTYQVPVNKPNQPDPIHTGSRTWYPGYPVPSTRVLGPVLGPGNSYPVPGTGTEQYRVPGTM